MRGNLYYEDNKKTLAKADFEKVHQQPDARLDPEKYNYLYTALGVMESKSDKKKSVAYFLKAATISPEVPNFVNLAMAYQAIQEYDKAEALLLQANAKKPKNKDVYIKLSALYFDSKQHDKAVRLLNKTIDLGFKDILFFKFRAYFYTALGNIEKAEEDIEVAIKMDKKVNNGIVKDEQLRSLIHNLQSLKKNTKK
jgi:tetratricopeptide (TPR) repeat protein